MQQNAVEQDFGIWRRLENAFRRHPLLRPARRTFRTTKHFLPGYWRLATERYRQLPAAVIVGAQKAGTTQLHLSLARHPRCFGGASKELHYFTKHRDRPLSWYRSQFPFEHVVRRVDGICLESTPSYLATPQALRMMRATLPDAKIIVLLRDPVTRAFSHYQHYKSRHLETRSFPDVVRDAVARREYAPVSGAACHPEAVPLLDYVYRGYYALQIEVLLDEYPREQVLILDSADLFENTNAVCQRVFDFLGLEEHDVSPKKIHNRGYYRDIIESDMAELLREHYRPHDELLVDLLGRRFRWMDAAAETAERDAA